MCSHTHALGERPPPAFACDGYPFKFLFFTSVFPDFAPFLLSLFVRLVRRLRPRQICFSAKRFNKISHILHPPILPPIFQLRCSSPLQARAARPRRRRRARVNCTCAAPANEPLGYKDHIVFLCFIYHGGLRVFGCAPFQLYLAFTFCRLIF